ncbi:hypothetical protein DFJ73DRAFT_27729 [Zopfochytrium polystomum]|nr:hypothetical protein DFJ73DRAFT_27729 [Zopfochytrium polystomum]
MGPGDWCHFSLRIMQELGFMRKIERRALDIKRDDITRFAMELGNINWNHYNLVFLYKVSFDNRGLPQSCGYALEGQRLRFHSEFRRLPRVSLLCFIGVGGLLESVMTEGTFTQLKFVDACCNFALKSGEHEFSVPSLRCATFLRS